MLFPLANIRRRSVRDPDGEFVVVPKLLYGRAASRLVEQAIAVFDEAAGKARDEYDAQTLEAVMGDYRLGRCIEACLLAWYAFEQPGMGDLLAVGEQEALQARDIASPSLLRFALWDAANARGGFVLPEERSQFLSDLAREWGLVAEPERLDKLAVMDSDAAAVLRLKGEPPHPSEVLQLYNRGVVKTLLAHSTQVQFRLGSLPGDALRKAYFMAKRNGVLVDIEKDAPGGFVLTLFGPEQAFGTADKYGRRLADVALSLLRSLLGSAPGSAIQGTASLILHDRPYRFHITGEVLQRLEYAPAYSEHAPAGRLAETVAAYSVGSVLEPEMDEEAVEPTFDSLVEAALYRSFKSLERQGYTHGWRIQREPDPLLADPGVVLIPDFAFVRGERRVFMEVAGFWSPLYREKKVAKLRALSGNGDVALILAVPQDAATTFAGLPFPTVAYKKDVRATDMLALLNRHFGEREARQEVAELQFAGLQKQAQERGFVPERDVASALQAFSRSELLSAVPRLESPDTRYIAGVGLLSSQTVAKLRADLLVALSTSPDLRMPLDSAASVVASSLRAPQIDVEVLIQIWPDLQIDRPSLFEAFLRRS